MIIDKIHERFKYMNDARAREIRIDKQLRKVFCTLSLPNAANLAADKRKEIIDFISTQIPTGFTCSVKFAEDIFTEVSFRKFLDDLLKSRYPLFSSIEKNKIMVAIEGRHISVEFSVGKVTKENMEVAEFAANLDVFFKDYTCYIIDIKIKLDEDEPLKYNRSEQERLVHLAINKELLKPSRYFRVDNVKQYIGKAIKSAPMYIYDVRGPMDSCALCGRITAKTTKSSRNNPNIQVCKFTLTDDSQASISCVMFVKFQITDVEAIKATSNKSDAEARTLSAKAKLANEKKMDKILKLYDDTDVIVRGKISFNDYSERLEMIVYDMCKCQVLSTAEQPKVGSSVPENYLLIEPEVYTQFQQTSFVDEKEFRSALQDKKYVLMHVNATGLNAKKDKIIAICAIKIVKGRIVSKLFTYVNPDMSVDASVLKDAKTSMEKLVFYPTLTEIIADLYKFTYGCEIVGLNLSHIVELLDFYAAPMGYKFTNNLIDQSTFLSSLFDTSTFERKPNCSKYVEVSKVCKVSCPSYVFCGETAVTIAKCLCVVASNQELDT